jgi:hypothetical protein
MLAVNEREIDCLPHCSFIFGDVPQCFAECRTGHGLVQVVAPLEGFNHDRLPGNQRGHPQFNLTVVGDNEPPVWRRGHKA